MREGGVGQARRVEGDGGRGRIAAEGRGAKGGPGRGEGGRGSAACCPGGVRRRLAQARQFARSRRYRKTARSGKRTRELRRRSARALRPSGGEASGGKELPGKASRRTAGTLRQARALDRDDKGNDRQHRPRSSGGGRQPRRIRTRLGQEFRPDHRRVLDQARTVTETLP